MLNTDTTSLPDLVIYDDRLLLDTADPSTYTVCTTAADIAAALPPTATRRTADVARRDDWKRRRAALRGLRHDAQARRLPQRRGLLHRHLLPLGPYTRESGYYRTRELAQAAFVSGAYGR
jgi:hypothetical protein